MYNVHTVQKQFLRKLIYCYEWSILVIGFEIFWQSYNIFNLKRSIKYFKFLMYSTFNFYLVRRAIFQV